MHRLPDIPNAGFATQNDRIASDSIMTFIREIERDRVRLLTVVVDGPDKWRTVAGSIFKGSNVDDEALDAMYRYLVLMSATPNDQMRLMATERNVAAYRDVVTSVMPDIERQLNGLMLQRKWGA